MNYEIQNI